MFGVVRVMFVPLVALSALLSCALSCLGPADAVVVYLRSDAEYAAFLRRHDEATVALFDESHPASLAALRELADAVNARHGLLAAVHAPGVARFRGAPMPHVFQLDAERRRLSGAPRETNVYVYGTVDLASMPEHLLVFINDHGLLPDEALRAVRESAAQSRVPHVVLSLETQGRERVVQTFGAAHGPEHRAFRVTRADEPRETTVIARLGFTTAAEFTAARGRLRL